MKKDKKTKIVDGLHTQTVEENEQGGNKCKDCKKNLYGYPLGFCHNCNEYYYIPAFMKQCVPLGHSPQRTCI